MKSLNGKDVKIFTTLRRVEGNSDYAQRLTRYFNRNDQYGFAGALIFQNNSNDIEPWVIAQELLVRSASQSPFIAVNPVYAHPYTVAQKIASYIRLYGRKIYLNFIAGTSVSDLASLNGFLSHDDRYDRLTEYVQIVRHLLSEPAPLTFEGKHYKTRNLLLPGAARRDTEPEYFIAGHSESARQARSKTGARRIEMARPLAKMAGEPGKSLALHFGVVTAATAEEAERRLYGELGPQYPDAAELLECSMSNTDAVWKRQLLTETEDEVFRLTPFRNFNADCPYLVGSFQQVAAYLRGYLARGADMFVIEAAEEDLQGLRLTLDLVHSGFREMVI